VLPNPAGGPALASWRYLPPETLGEVAKRLSLSQDTVALMRLAPETFFRVWR